MCSDHGNKRKRFIGNILSFLAIALGLLAGILHNAVVFDAASFISDLFLRLLKLISLPIIFLSIAATITGMKDFQEMKRMGRKVLLYTIGTTIVAASIGLVLFLVIDPVKSVGVVGDAVEAVVPKQGSYLAFVKNIFPPNLVQAFAENNVVGIACVAMLFSIAALFLPKEQKEFTHKIFSSLFAVVLKVTTFIIFLMPVAIWAFVTLLVKELGEHSEHFQSIALFLACVALANLIQGIVVLPLLLKMKKISPIATFRGMLPALTLAFFSKSSNATLPVTMSSVENNLGVSKKVSGFSLPLCAVINMNGCAAFILISVLFVSMFNGIVFSGWELVGWILFATIAAIGNAGVPMGCFFLASAFLIGMDVPLYMMGLILPFYTFLDMLETALNVWSDSVITVALDKDLKLVEAKEASPAI